MNSNLLFFNNNIMLVVVRPLPYIEERSRASRKTRTENKTKGCSETQKVLSLLISGPLQ